MLYFNDFSDYPILNDVMQTHRFHMNYAYEGYEIVAPHYQTIWVRVSAAGFFGT